jgi:hypothetical protein
LNSPGRLVIYLAAAVPGIIRNPPKTDHTLTSTKNTCPKKRRKKRGKEPNRESPHIHSKERTRTKHGPMQILYVKVPTRTQKKKRKKGKKGKKREKKGKKGKNPTHSQAHAFLFPESRGPCFASHSKTVS